MINSHRHLFPSAAASHIKDITHKLERLVPIRNRVMHSRPLHAGDFPTTFDLVDRLANVRVGPWTEVRNTLNLLTADPSSISNLRIPVLPSPSVRVAHNLPTPDFDETGFVGRDDFLSRTITAVLGQYPVITIFGEGGIGKSAVALKAAYDILDSPDCPFDLVIWASSKTHALTGPDIQRISDSIATSLDLISDVSQALGRTNVGDPVDALLDDLTALPTLLILDNLETVLDDRIRSFLGRLPRGTKVLLTSRIALGAFEHPLKLDPMNGDDTVVLMRALARARHVDSLVHCRNRTLQEYTARLHNNPGFIKWFVAGVQAGARPEDLLANPDTFLDFCFTNVYDHLSDDAKTALRCLVPLSEASLGDIGYHANLEGFTLTEAVNDLLRTNMVSTHYVSEGATYDTYYQVTEIAAQYLVKHHPLSPQELRHIEDNRRKIVAVHEQIAATGRRDPYQRTAIFLRSRRDIVPAKYLRDALRLSRQADFDHALEALSKAARLAPEYFEVHRVKGVVLAEAGKIFEAETAYQHALEFKEDYGPLLYGYALFLMHNRDDVEGAAEFAARALRVDPGIPAVMLELGRARLYMEDFDGAREALEPLQSTRPRLSAGDAQKSVDLYCQTFLREADLAVRSREFLAGLEAFERAREYFETIPQALTDRRLGIRLTKGVLSAVWLVDGMARELPSKRERAERIRQWLASGGSSATSGVTVERTGEDITVGKVTSLPVRENFGFLEAEDGAELFFHRESLEDVAAWEALSIGAGVSFRVGEDDEGRPRAIDLRVEHPGHLIWERRGRELEGIVKSIVGHRGFGFVRANEGPSYFFHRSLAQEWGALEEGCGVTFVVGINPRDGNICARDVRVLE
ncbi:hypothetical protein [Candidatus Palauibacter sp.]|uniref:hypothetical protein n=1 Tax=Candidatus Palauibacter sp. TaxID=3101350 RepID=UPI003B51D627